MNISSSRPHSPQSFGQLQHLEGDDTDPPSGPIGDDDDHENGDGGYENGGGKIPKLLKNNASNAEIVNAVNGIAIEIQLTRQAVASIGKRVGEHEETVKASFNLMEKAILNRLSGIESMLRPALKVSKPRKKRSKKGK